MKTELREVKRVRIVSSLKVFSMFGVLFAILSMVWYLLIMSYPDIALTLFGLDTSMLTFSVVLISSLMTLIAYAFIGLIFAVCYNLIAKYVGGIKVELD